MTSTTIPDGYSLSMFDGHYLVRSMRPDGMWSEGVSFWSERDALRWIETMSAYDAEAGQ